MKQFIKKFGYFVLSLFIGIIVMLFTANIFAAKAGEVMYFKVYIIALISAVMASGIWILRNKDWFENFVVSFAYLCFFCFLLFIGPATLERSLSVFIYFYAVQNGSIKQDIYNDAYFRQFAQRRFDDSQTIGFLQCDEDRICTPTIKAKILYKVFYPYGRLTKCLYYYDEFKKMLDETK